MVIKLKHILTVALFAALLAPTAAAQDLSQSSQSPSNTRDTALGANIGSETDGMSESVPELQQVDRARDLRDVSSRGSFVGADSGDATFFGSASQGRGSTGGSRRIQRSTSRGSYRPGSRQSQRGRSRGTTLRPRLALGFHYVPQLSPRLAENVRTCLNRIPSLRENPSIRVRVANNTVVLEGTVATAHDRALSAQLVALSPGVNAIDNRLKVVSRSSEPSQPD